MTHMLHPLPFDESPFHRGSARVGKREDEQDREKKAARFRRAPSEEQEVKAGQSNAPKQRVQSPRELALVSHSPLQLSGPSFRL